MSVTAVNKKKKKGVVSNSLCEGITLIHVTDNA